MGHGLNGRSTDVTVGWGFGAGNTDAGRDISLQIPVTDGTFPCGSGITLARRTCRWVGLRPARRPFAGGLE